MRLAPTNRRRFDLAPGMSVHAESCRLGCEEPRAGNALQIVVFCGRVFHPKRTFAANVGVVEDPDDGILFNARE